MYSLKMPLFTLLLLLITACAAESLEPLPNSAPISTPTTAPTAVPTATTAPEPRWELVWQDEFDGTEIDWSKWSREVNGRGGGNNELQYYTDKPENSFIENGNLVIQALKPDKKYIGRSYTSARLRTLGQGDWLYGRFEIRAKMPEGQGLWPAIWMLPSDWKYGGWPSSGEIDIMELLGHEPDTIHGTLHYGSPSNHIFTGEEYVLESGNFVDEFHVFALEWEEKEIRWYLNGELIQTQNSWITSNKEYPAPFDQRFHIILNVAVGGQWPGSPDETTTFPQQMVVDYVRVYQLSD